MKVRIVYKPDKSVIVIHPAPKSRRPDETEKEWLERVLNKSMQGGLEGLPYDDVDKSELPQSREDRSAWEGEKGKGVKVNTAKAKQIKKEREERQLIEQKQAEILERQAREELIAEDKLPA